MFGALEAGGTKMIAAVLDDSGTILDKLTMKTGAPEETVPALVAYFRSHPVKALGIGSFGPLCLDVRDPDYGSITTTPKLQWRNYPLYSVFRDALGIPVGIDTDVNASAIGEAGFGCAKGFETSLYITVGTGIGAGVIVNGRPLHGAMHPECGHILLRPRANDPLPDGICPSHKHCFEGLASGPSLEARWGKPAYLIEEDAAWDLEAEYLAEAIWNFTAVLSPQIIILGGGVMKHRALFPLIRDKFSRLSGGYVRNPFVDRLGSYIVPESLGGGQALYGCFVLAGEASK